MATKKAHEQFNKAVIAHLLSVGAVETGDTMYKYKVMTKAGPLLITVHDPEASSVFSIYMRFEDFERTKALLPNVIVINPKWNIHEWTAEEALRILERRLDQVDARKFLEPLAVIDETSNQLQVCLDLYTLPEEAVTRLNGEINQLQQTLQDHNYEPKQ